MTNITRIASLEGHQDRVWDVDVHSRKPLLATASGDKTCRIYNLNTLQLVTVLEDAHKRSCRSVSWKPDSTGTESPSIAVGSFDSTISIWSEEEGSWELLAIIEGHENEVKSVDWSYNGFFLASCSRDKSVWIWEADDTNEEFECISVLQEHTQDVKCVRWHPSEELVASSSYDDSVRLYKEDPDEGDWVCVTELQLGKGTVWEVDFSSGKGGESEFVAVTDEGEVEVYRRIGSNKELNTGESSGNGVGSELQFMGRIPSTFRSSEPLKEEWEIAASLPKVCTRALYGVSWSKHSDRIATVGADGKLVVYSRNAEGEWAVSGTVEKCHGVHEVNCVRWAFRGSDECLITGGDDGKTNVWAVEREEM